MGSALYVVGYDHLALVDVSKANQPTVVNASLMAYGRGTGSAVVGNACFTCITGEADASSDYEIDEVLKSRGR